MTYVELGLDPLPIGVASLVRSGGHVLRDDTPRVNQSLVLLDGPRDAPASTLLLLILPIFGDNDLGAFFLLLLVITVVILIFVITGVILILVLVDNVALEDILRLHQRRPKNDHNEHDGAGSKQTPDRT